MINILLSTSNTIDHDEVLVAVIFNLNFMNGSECSRRYGYALEMSALYYPYQNTDHCTWPSWTLFRPRWS